MIVRLKKTHEGTALSVERADGSVDWQRNSHGDFFALHDLTHLVVESVLGFDQAFFGLLASGWDMKVFSDKTDPRYGQVPDQAKVTEHLVAVLSRRVLENERLDASLRDLWRDEVNLELAACLRKSGLALHSLSLDQLLTIGERLEAAVDAWSRLPMGETLKFQFPLEE